MADTEDDLGRLRELEAERRKVDSETEGHIRRAEFASEEVGADWINRAACKGLDPEWWFPDIGKRGVAKRAKAVCWDKCPVRLECLESACLRRDFGIWGGFTYTDRQANGFDYDNMKHLGRN